MIKELIIRGDFEVEGMPTVCSRKLKHLKITAKETPYAFISIDEFSSIDHSNNVNKKNRIQNSRNPQLMCPKNSAVDCYDKTKCEGCRFEN